MTVGFGSFLTYEPGVIRTPAYQPVQGLLRGKKS